MVWDPFEEVEKILKRMRRSIFREFYYPEEFEVSSFPVDLSETEDEIIVRADLPGFSKDEIAIRLRNGSLEIAAKHKEEKKEVGERFFKVERKLGSYYRSIPLPMEIDEENVRASYKDGVLEVRLRKKVPRKKGKEIKIE